MAYAVVLLVLGLGLAAMVGKGKKPGKDGQPAPSARELSQQAEQRQATGAGQAAGAAPAATTPTAAIPIGYGLTFAFANDSATPADIALMSCHGAPQQLDQPHKDSCNPYKGDTSCRTVLPVLCIQKTGAAPPQGVSDSFYQGWTQGVLSATQPVMGAVLSSEAVASARCEAELGSGWRMAEFHDGAGGWGLQGVRGSGLGTPGQTRYWVHINDQKGNCWNSGQ